MELLEKAVLLPDSEHLSLLRIIAAILLFIYVAFTGIFAGSFSLGVLLHLLFLREPDERFLRFARELVTFVTKNPGTLLLLALLPVITLLFTFTQIYQGTQFPIGNYFLTLFVLTGLGIAAGFLYRRLLRESNASFFSLIPGLLSVGLMVAGFFLLANVIGLQLLPEKWPFVNPVFPLFATINALPWFLLLTLVVFALTGVAILYFFFRWPDRQPSEDQNYTNLVLKTSASLALVSLLLQPLAILWVLKTLPVVAKSGGSYLLWSLSIIILMIAAVTLLSVMLNETKRPISPAFGFFLAAFLAMMTASQIAGGTAAREKAAVLVAKAEELHNRVLEEREARMAEAMNFDGSEIFNRICSACHKFDVKVVGPPLNSVKGKYQNDLESLKAFILKPVKIRPDYPPMPNQGLNRFEVDAVAKYLIAQWQTQK